MPSWPLAPDDPGPTPAWAWLLLEPVGLVFMTSVVVALPGHGTGSAGLLVGAALLALLSSMPVSLWAVVESRRPPVD